MRLGLLCGKNQIYQNNLQHYLEFALKLECTNVSLIKKLTLPENICNYPYPIPFYSKHLILLCMMSKSIGAIFSKKSVGPSHAIFFGCQVVKIFHQKNTIYIMHIFFIEMDETT
jgi:hypothetical protein